MELFDRKYSLIIGSDRKTIRQAIPTQEEKQARLKREGLDGMTSAPQDFTVIPARFVEITKSQMTAIIKVNKEQGIPAEVNIYNLSEETIKNIKKNDTLILKAGYKYTKGLPVNTFMGEIDSKDLPTIFIGQISHVYTDYNKSKGTITRIVCNDSMTAKKNIKVSASWPPGVVRSKVVEDLVKYANSRGVPTGSIAALQTPRPDNAELFGPFLAGYSVHGWLFEVLEQICDSLGLRFFTSLGRIYIEPKVSPDSMPTVTLGPNNIKASIKAESASSPDGDTSDDPQGIKVTTLLDGRISIVDILNLRDCGEYDGDYKINSLEYSLDYQGDDWHVEASCSKL